MKVYRQRYHKLRNNVWLCKLCSVFKTFSESATKKKKKTKNTPNLKLSLPFRITLLRTSLSLLVHFLFKVTSSCTCGSALDLLWYVRTSSSLSCTTVQSDSNECSGGRITPDHAYSRSTLDTVDCDWNMLKTVQFFSSIQFYLYITKSQQQLPQGAAEIQHSPPTFTVQVTLKRNEHFFLCACLINGVKSEGTIQVVTARPPGSNEGREHKKGSDDYGLVPKTFWSHFSYWISKPEEWQFMWWFVVHCQQRNRATITIMTSNTKKRTQSNYDLMK